VPISESQNFRRKLPALANGFAGDHKDAIAGVKQHLRIFW